MNVEFFLQGLTDKSLQTETTRRRFLQGSGLLLTSLALPFLAAGCDFGRSKDPKPIDEKVLQQIYETLDGTGSLLFKKVVTGLREFRKVTRERPLGIPEWVSNDSFPIGITVEPINISDARTMAYGMRPLKYAIGSRNGVEQVDGVAEEYRWSINLTDPPNLDKTWLFALSITAAKEFLTLLTIANVGEDFYNIAQQTSGIKLTDVNGGLISDPNTQKAIGLDLFYKELKRPSSSAYAKLVDRFPMLMVTQELSELEKQSKIPGDLSKPIYFLPDNLRTFRGANSEARRQLTQVTSEWLSSDSIMFTTTLRKQLYLHPLSDLALSTRTG